MLKKQSNNIKLIALFIAIILIIIALVFGVSKFILKDQDENTPIQFNEYKVQEQEIVLSSEEYTGDSIIVTVTPSILPVVNSGKTGIDVMKLQYQITEPDAILSNNDNDWIDYIEPVEVDHNSTFNTRLVTRGHTDTSLEMDYTSPVTSREINNIAVAQLGNKTYKTLAEAITAWGDLTTEEKQTSTIQMLANTSENIIIPQTEEIKIDLCGFDIIEESSETPTIIVNGVLNIVDSGNSTTYGKVTSTSNTAIKVTGANSELVLGTNESANGEDDEEVNKEGPVINGGTGSNGVLVEQGGNLEFYDGKITAPKTAQAGANTAIVVNNTPVGNENGNLITVPTGYRLDLSDDETAGREIATVVKKMMVSFDSNGGEPSNIADIEVGEGKAYGKYAEWPSDPTREGYTFKGWSTNLADVISENNYSIYNFDNRTTSEFRNDGEFLGLTNQPYIRIKGNESNSNIDTLWSISAKNEINVTAGKKYILSFYARSENSIRTQYIGMYSNSVSGKTSIGWSDGSITYLEEDINFDNDGEWHLITKEFIAPDNVSTGKIKIGNDIPNIYGTNSYIDIANIHFSEDESIVPYITQSTPVTQAQNHTLKAIWTPNQYTISFNANDGTGSMSNQTMTYGTAANLTANSFTRTGYIFDGWNTESDGSGESYTDGQSVTNLTASNNATINLYAQWTPIVASTTIGGTTTYYRTVQDAIDAVPADGTSQSEGTLGTVTLLYDGTREESVVVSEGQNVLFNTNGKTLTSATNTITNNGEIKITGTGRIESTNTYTNQLKYKTFSVINNGDMIFEQATIYSSTTGGIYNDETGKLVVNSGTINVNSAGIVNDSKNIENNIAAVEINDIEIITNANCIVNRYSYTHIKDGTYTQNNNDGDMPAIINGYLDGAVVTGKIKIDNARVTASNTARAVYQHSSEEIEINGGTYNGNISVSCAYGKCILNDGIFTGTQSGINIHNGGEVVLGNKDDLEVKIDSPIVISNGVGVVFASGKFDFYDGIIKAPTGQTISGTVSDTPEGYYVTNGTDGSLETAYLENDYTVTYDYNGATSGNTVINKTVGYGENYGTLPQPEKTGYTFEGWNGKNLFELKEAPDFINTNTSYSVNIGENSINIGGNQKWELIEYYLPTLKANTTYSISGYVELTNLDKTFIRISKNRAAINNNNFISSITVTQNGKFDSTFTTGNEVEDNLALLLYGNWEKEYEVEGGKVKISNLMIEENSTATEYEPYFVTPSTPVTQAQNHTLKAIWTPNQYTVSFNANDGTGTMADQPMTYGTSANLTANSFTRTGYAFNGWNTEADGSGTSYTDEESVSNLTATNNASVTLYAQWEVETSGLNNASPNMQLQSITPKSLNRNNIQTIQPENTQQSVQSQITNTVQINQTQYPTIAEALESAQNGDTITLLEDVSLTDEVIIGKEKNIKINLNGKTLTSTSNNTINNQGILTIKGTGIIKNEIENGIVIYNTGSLNMEDGVVTTAENGGKAISNNGDGSNYQGSDTNNVEKSGNVNIKSGKIVTEGIGAIGLYNANNAKANISGGIFETRNYASKAIYNDSELEIENAKVVVSDYDSIGIYNGKNSKSCIIKETEIFIEAEEIENYDLIKNTDQFKEYIDKLKPSYGIYNDSDSEVIIETATIKAERLKSVGIMNNTKGTVTLGVDESKDGKEIELNNASPIVYAISDNTTAIINNKDGIINFYDGRVLTTSTIKNMIVNVLNNYEIYEELNSNVINTTLRLIVEEVERGSVDSNSEEISENESSEENENVDNESEDI